MDIRNNKTNITFSKQHAFIRQWKSNPWEFLPPSMSGCYRKEYEILDGLPEKIKKRMSIRGYTFVGYPYPRLGYLSDKPKLTEMNMITLENERFRVVVAGRLGPRVLEIHDKKFNIPLVLPFTCMNSVLVGLTGAWILGGLEFNPFRLGHTVFIDQDVPIDELRFKNGDSGLKFCLLDELVNMELTLILRLFPDGVSWRACLKNLLDIGQPLYYYTNMAVPCNEDTILLFEPGPLTHHDHPNPGFVTDKWPIINGRDCSRWGNHTHVISGYFYRYRKPYMGFCDPSSGAAVLHASNTNVLKGRKLWSISARDSYQIWWPRCYENGMASYCEIQAGLSPIQLQYEWINPRQTITWTESITGLRFSPSHTYNETWNDFVKKADKLKILERHSVSKKWEIAANSTVVKIHKRQQNAYTALALMNSNKVDAILDLTSDANLKTGWVAGDAWKEALLKCNKNSSASCWVKLQLAANFLIKKEVENALQILDDNPDGENLLRMLWFRLKAAIFYMTGNTAEAYRLIDKALRIKSDEPILWKEAFEYYRSAGDIAGRRRLLTICPKNILKTDFLRYETAFLYFDERNFSDAIRILSSEFRDIGENFFGPWYLWRECWIAWGLELWESGDIKNAYSKFYSASQDAAQFGIGRGKSEDTVAAYFYRWWISRENGDEALAHALEAQVLKQMPYPLTDSAFYLLRMAVAVKHKSAKIRREQIEKWRAAELKRNIEEPVWRKAMLDAIDTNQISPLWKKIPEKHFLKCRADFESRHRLNY